MVGTLAGGLVRSATQATGRLTMLGPLPLHASPEPVYPSEGSGFAAYIVGGFLALGILILFMIWTSRRPKRPS